MLLLSHTVVVVTLSLFARDGRAGSFRGHTYTLVVYLVISRKLEELESGRQDLQRIFRVSYTLTKGSMCRVWQ